MINSVRALVQVSVCALCLSCGGGQNQNLIPIVSAGPDQQIQEQSQSSLSATARDPDGSFLKLSWKQIAGPEVDLSDVSVLAPTFTAPAIDFDQTLTFELTVTDSDGAASSDTVSVSVIANELNLNAVEGSVIGTVIGDIEFPNEKQFDSSDLTLTGDWAEKFGVSTNGELEVKAALHNFEALDSYELLATHFSGGVATESLKINVHLNQKAENAWSRLQNEIDSQGSGAVIELNGELTYVLDSTLNLRDFRDVHIHGNGATILRVNSDEVSTKLAKDYVARSPFVDVESIPENYRVGDYIAIATGRSVEQATKNPRRIVGFTGNRIHLSSSFYDHYPARESTTVFKTFPFIAGLPSHIAGGSNPGIIIEGIIFDGNARNNKVNYSWLLNMAIGLHGGKTSVIRNNKFFDMPNETIVGHGFDVHDNVFDGLNGSAIHMSVHDNTKSINGLAVFENNVVTNVNRIPKGLNGHSEGAVTFSWGGGNLTVKNNFFSSETGNYGVMGIFAGQPTNTDENLTFMNNEAHNFEYIIKIISPPASPSRNILITQNMFSDSGINDLTHLAGDASMRFGCNELRGNTQIIIDDSNDGCE